MQMAEYRNESYLAMSGPQAKALASYASDDATRPNLWHAKVWPGGVAASNGHALIRWMSDDAETEADSDRDGECVNVHRDVLRRGASVAGAKGFVLVPLKPGDVVVVANEHALSHEDAPVATVGESVPCADMPLFERVVAIEGMPALRVGLSPRYVEMACRAAKAFGVGVLEFKSGSQFSATAYESATESGVLTVVQMPMRIGNALPRGVVRRDREGVVIEEHADAVSP